MTEKPLDEEERKFAERLRREAAVSRPAFSESLHARLCAAIRHEKAWRPATARTRTLRAWLAYSGVAAACLVGAALWLSRGPRHCAVAPEPCLASANPLAALADTSDAAVVEFGSLVDATLARRPWADLDRDAQTAANLLLENLPLDLLVHNESP